MAVVVRGCVSWTPQSACFCYVSKTNIIGQNTVVIFAGQIISSFLTSAATFYISRKFGVEDLEDDNTLPTAVPTNCIAADFKKPSTPL